MNIVAFFLNAGVPATGLAPTIRIRNVTTNVLTVTDAAMSEVGDGFYKYDFSSYNADIDYAIRCDGGISLSGAERYTYAGSDDLSAMQESINQVSTQVLSVSASLIDISADIKRTLGLMHENIFIDNPTYDSDGNLIGARVRIYSTAVDVGTASNVIGTYTITSAPDGPGKFTNWKQVRA